MRNFPLPTFFSLRRLRDFFFFSKVPSYINSLKTMCSSQALKNGFSLKKK